MMNSSRVFFVIEAESWLSRGLGRDGFCVSGHEVAPTQPQMGSRPEQAPTAGADAQT